MEGDSGLLLYDYWRSSAAYRVRIALHLKSLDFRQLSIDLVRDGGVHRQASFLSINPQGLVPALVHDGKVLTQSMAICEYLDEAFPNDPLLPESIADRAQARAAAQLVACDVHPLNNLRVQQYLAREFDVDEAALQSWMHHWMATGFDALEKLLDNAEPMPFCFSSRPGLVECFLLPQVYNAERFKCDMGPYKRIQRVVERCRELPAFTAAAPELQPDAPIR